MAYEMVMPYHLHMPSYFLETFTEYPSLIALFLVYVFEAIMFPTIFAISLKGLGGKTKRASSFLMMSPVGGAVGPVLMGYVADNSTMSLSFIIPFVSFCIVLFYSWYADVERN